MQGPAPGQGYAQPDSPSGEGCRLFSSSCDRRLVTVAASGEVLGCYADVSGGGGGRAWFATTVTRAYVPTQSAVTSCQEHSGRPGDSGRGKRRQSKHVFARPPRTGADEARPGRVPPLPRGVWRKGERSWVHTAASSQGTHTVEEPLQGRHSLIVPRLARGSGKAPKDGEGVSCSTVLMRGRVGHHAPFCAKPR